MYVTVVDLFATVGVDSFVVKTCGIFSWKHWWSWCQWCGDGHKRQTAEKDEQHDDSFGDNVILKRSPNTIIKKERFSLGGTGTLPTYIPGN